MIPNSGRRKKILITTSTFPLDENDPTPRFVMDLAARLARRYLVYVLAPSTPESKAIKKENNTIVIRHRYFFKCYELLAHKDGMLENLKKNPWLYVLVPAFFFSQMIYIACLKKRIGFSLLNAHWIYPQALAALICKKSCGFNFPILCTVHGGDLFALKSLNCLKKWVLERVDHTLVVGGHMKEYCRRELGFQGESLDVRSMGVDLERRFIDYGEPRNDEFLFVGRIAEKKGLGILLGAVDRLRNEGLVIHLTVIGKGSELPQYEDSVKRNKLDKQVTFLGAVPNKDLPSFYNRYRYFVFPSIKAESGDQEGMPLSPVEAMGCGCVVISSSLDSASDYMEHTRTGYIFQSGSVESLAQVMRQALHEVDKHKNLVDSAKAMVANKFDWNVVTKDYQKVIDGLV